MNLHLTMLIFHNVFFCAEIISLILLFWHPIGWRVKAINLNRILLFITQSSSQLILMYLMWKLNQTGASKQSSEAPEAEEAVEEDTLNAVDVLLLMKLEVSSRSSISSARSNSLRNSHATSQKTINHDFEEDVAESTNEAALLQERAEKSQSLLEEGFDEPTTATSLDIAKYNRMSGGNEEARLRAAIFVSFVKPLDDIAAFIGDPRKRKKQQQKEKMNKMYDV